ncbi:MAG: thiamine pyrophosphate-dependent enzyme [Candidatus Thorarchaeota archaeon]
MGDINTFDMGKDTETAWCPGCGNFGILRIMKTALSELDLQPKNVVFVSGIGQAAKFPQYLKCHYFNGLHGRSLPAAMAIKAANPEMTVICESGDGCSYGEGGNHFVHTILRNPDMTNIVHNNAIYGLTKGQASPTSQFGLKTPVQVSGVTNEPFNPLAVAISLNASFVARAFVGDIEKAKEIYKKAIEHKGYALIDLLCPCVTFNHVNTFQWYKENSYYIDEAHDPYDQNKAMNLALDSKKLALGVLYISPNKRPYEENVQIYKQDKRPLYQRELDISKFKKLIESFR